MNSKLSIKNKKVIEIGCGTGKNTIILSKVATKVLGIDFSEGMLEKARIKLMDKKNIKLKFADITEKWSCEENYYDVVMCNLVLEHIENLFFIFSEANRVLIESGVPFSTIRMSCLTAQLFIKTAGCT